MLGSRKPWGQVAVFVQSPAGRGAGRESSWKRWLVVGRWEAPWPRAALVNRHRAALVNYERGICDHGDKRGTWRPFASQLWRFWLPSPELPPSRSISRQAGRRSGSPAPPLCSFGVAHCTVHSAAWPHPPSSEPQRAREMPLEADRGCATRSSVLRPSQGGAASLQGGACDRSAGGRGGRRLGCGVLCPRISRAGNGSSRRVPRTTVPQLQASMQLSLSCMEAWRKRPRGQAAQILPSLLLLYYSQA